MNATDDSFDSQSGYEESVDKEVLVRVIALVICSASIVLQFFFTVMAEIWRRHMKKDRDSYYYTPIPMLVLQAICLLLIELFYILRILKLPTEDNAQLMYGEMIVTCSLALMYQVFRFPSVREVSPNLSAICHVITCIHIFSRNGDYYAAATSFIAAVLSGVRPPRAYKYKTE